MPEPKSASDSSSSSGPEPSPELLQEDLPLPGGATIRLWTLNRPEQRNAISQSLLAAMEGALAGLNPENGIRGLIITGSGPAFCAGADLKERATMSQDDVHAFLNRMGRLFRQIETLSVPTLAAINGFCFGGGLEMALCADFRMASGDAKMGLTETSLGIIPGAGGTQRLPRIIGQALATEMILSAERIDAETALKRNLIREITDDAESLRRQSLRWMQKVCENAPLSLVLARQAIEKGMEMSLEEGLKLERQLYEKTLETEDRLEALQAFKEKRKPQFKGR
ncbi:MAG: enoyl-CoA hydratase/isomerase family protein [Leptospiraceae bacterium]|nr:enoyl-CoA hydratase/isomerase family protein [Leptospiraceae bacterium]